MARTGMMIHGTAVVRILKHQHIPFHVKRRRFFKYLLQRMDTWTGLIALALAVCALIWLLDKL